MLTRARPEQKEQMEKGEEDVAERQALERCAELWSRVDEKELRMGWVALVSIGAMYHLIPRLFGVEIYSKKLIETHFWVATIGIVLYITSMWISGIMQGLMWRAVNTDGTLTYSFVESVQAMHPFYIVRFMGGAIFLTGMLIMAYNVFKTVSAGKAIQAPIPEPAAAH